MRRFGRYLPIALVVGIALPLIGCPLIVLKICVSNETEYDLVELNVSDTGAVSWGANELAATLGPGQNVCLKDISAGDYDIRALFDVKEAGKALVPCYNWGVEFTTLNLALTYLWDGEECYSTLDWYL